MKFSAFVRIRPHGVEEGVKTDQEQLDDLVALALSPLPPDDGTYGFQLPEERFDGS